MNETANGYDSIIEELRSRIHFLENENRLLKERLDEAGILYADIVSHNSDNSALLHLGWASYIYKLGFLTPDAALA